MPQKSYRKKKSQSPARSPKRPITLSIWQDLKVSSHAFLAFTSCFHIYGSAGTHEQLIKYVTKRYFLVEFSGAIGVNSLGGSVVLVFYFANEGI